MRIGLLARADNTGLGHQTWEFYRHLRPTKVMLVEYGGMKYMKWYPERYAGADVQVVVTIPDQKEIRQFLEDLDVVFICETPYSYSLFEIARSMGVRTVLQPNYEYTLWMRNKKVPQPDLLAIPTAWHYDEFPEPKVELPVPIATDRFTWAGNDAERSTAKRFLHVAGLVGVQDRNGTPQLFAALQHVTSHIRLEVFCQKKGYIESVMGRQPIPRNVTVVHNATEPEHYWDMYREQDAMIMPRRFGGLCLPVNEGIGALLPVLMADVSPNNAWLPEEWLVPARKAESFEARRNMPVIDAYDVEPKALAARIDMMATDPAFYGRQMEQVRQLREERSWESLSKLYIDALASKVRA